MNILLTVLLLPTLLAYSAMLWIAALVIEAIFYVCKFIGYLYYKLYYLWVTGLSLIIIAVFVGGGTTALTLGFLRNYEAWFQ